MTDIEVTRIKVGKHPTGIIGLKESLKAVAEEMRGAAGEKIRDALLERLGKKNYIAPNAINIYGQAFLREYKRFVGEPFNESESSGLEIKVVGPGCPRCEQIEQMLMALIAEMKINADLDHVRDPLEIGKYGMMSMPALVINGEIKMTGGVPPKEKLKAWLEQAASKIKK
ncbi:MAG: thioredoxin family protein [Desulfobacteraceae bacterium]|nr:MAG: thioredoxin family protein [Desulfobacteraceae bacterium]